MCRNTISIGWDGLLYDCDFNQMLDLPVESRAHVRDFDLSKLEAREIVTDRHCYGCTAGNGSSCRWVDRSLTPRCPPRRARARTPRGFGQTSRSVASLAQRNMTRSMKRAWMVAALCTAPLIARADDAYRSTVTGGTPAQQLRESAEAVTVVEPTEAKQESADFGAVLNRIPGVNIARTGGLGSLERISLNGFSNDQIRVFWNGIPLEVAGFAFGLSSVPLQLVDRVEIYRGVVPIRFGADALGGAINLVSETSLHGLGGAVSFEGGSFDTFRGSASGHYRDEQTGLYTGVSAFVDYTKNDYDVIVQVPDALGRLHAATVPRFHDAYEARGVGQSTSVASIARRRAAARC